MALRRLFGPHILYTLPRALNIRLTRRSCPRMRIQHLTQDLQSRHSSLLVRTANHTTGSSLVVESHRTFTTHLARLPARISNHTLITLLAFTLPLINKRSIPFSPDTTPARPRGGAFPKSPERWRIGSQPRDRVLSRYTSSMGVSSPDASCAGWTMIECEHPQTSSQVASIGEEEGADETKGSSETASKSSTSHYASGVFPSRGTSTKRRAKGARPLRRDLRREARRTEDGSSIFRMGGQWAVGGVSESEKKSGYQPRLHAGADVMGLGYCLVLLSERISAPFF